MGVTEDANIWMFTLQERSPFFRHLSVFVENMTHGNATTCQFNDDLGWKSALFPIVDVAGNGRNRCDLASPSITDRSPMSPAWKI